MVILALLVVFGHSIRAQPALPPSDSSRQQRPPVVTPWGAPLPADRATAAVDSERLSALPREGQNNLAALFKGRFSGLEALSTAGLPGASVVMTMRGRRSILNDNQLLILLDGIPVSNVE